VPKSALRDLWPAIVSDMFPSPFLREKTRSEAASSWAYRAALGRGTGLFFGPFRAVREYRIGRIGVDTPNYLKLITYCLENHARPACNLYRCSVDCHHSWLFVLGSS